jgi:hypothetical protein
MRDIMENLLVASEATTTPLSLPERASRSWRRSLADFFQPMLDWIFSEAEDPKRVAYLSQATDLVDLERRERDWERDTRHSYLCFLSARTGGGLDSA